MSNALMRGGVDSTPIRRCYKNISLGLVPLLVFYVVNLSVSDSEDYYRTLNGITPIYLMLVLLIPIARLVRDLPESLWSPAAWLPISFAVFYGFGPLVTVYGNEDTRWYMASTRLAASHSEVFRAHILSTVGIAAVIAGFWFAERVSRSRSSGASGQGSIIGRVNPAKLAVALVGFGGALRYLVVKPAEWGMLSLTVPGVVGVLGALTDVGYGLLAFSMSSAGSRRLRRLFWLTWPVHIFLSTLSLSKSEIITAMLMPALGAFVAHRNRRRFALNVAVMTVVFALAQPWVHFGRGIIEARTGSIGQAGYEERINLLVRYVSGERIPNARHDKIQSWWTRLNFSQAQAFAMRAHDSGMKSSTLSGAWMYFIPRAIWPGKPIMVGPGRSFHALVTGGEGTSFLALSVFGDLYWQFGWLGVIVICPIIGVFFSSLSKRSILIMRNRQFILIPVVLLALDMALLGMNKYLINGIIAGIPLYYGYLGLILLMSHFLSSIRRGKRSNSANPASARRV